MPDFPIADSHVHLYDTNLVGYDWLQRFPKLNRPYRLSDFDAARGPVVVDKIVFAEVWANPGAHLREADWVQAQADADPRLQGMIAHAPIEKGAAVEADLEALRRHRILKGIRRLIEIERDPSFCLEPNFLAGMAVLERHGLPFDLCVKHWHLVFAIELARRCPGVRFVLDHIGKPGIKHGLVEPWKSQLREIASLPNVWCKMSGVITEADHTAWSRDQLKPYLSHVVDCFGFSRLMYGSDWTVSELTHSYPDWVDILDELLKGSSEVELRRFWRDNAIEFYALPTSRGDPLRS
jgi:L-fuconolactonase